MNISKDTFIIMLEHMAAFGTAPKEGCSIFGVGYEEAFSRIKNKYLIEQFGRGLSSEKFVVGIYGSGKTHFLRQLMEISRELGCVTSEIELNKQIDFTNNLVVYSEIVHELYVPFSTKHGIKSLLEASIEKVKSLRQDKAIEELEEQIVSDWISGIDKVDFKLDLFGKVVKKALWAIRTEDEIISDLCCRWLEGDINDKSLSKEIDVPKIDKGSNNLYSKKMTMSLFQFIKHAGFPGTVVGFDEAEQGLSVNKKKTETICSKLMSDIEAITKLDRGSALIVYALTPDIVDKMKGFPALQQRITSLKGRGFFDGNTLAPLIELTALWESDPVIDLQRIGRKLVDISYKVYSEITVPEEDVLKVIDKTALDIYNANSSISNRRDMIKSSCSILLDLIQKGELLTYIPDSQNLLDEEEV